jgi:23S rRNA pseudouridine1911/1915/1917 synthase
VNGRRAVKGTVLRAGDEVVVSEWHDEAPLAPVASPLTVLYEDDDVIAVDKPPAIPSTGGALAGASVAAMLLARHPQMAAIDPRRAAGLVHRLDTGTSGVLLAARHPAAWARARVAFAHRTVVKEYVAVVHGRLAAAARVDTRLARVRGTRGRMKPVTKAGSSSWAARTEILPLRTAEDLTLVALRMRTGVTHQLRVHLASLGHSVLGDLRYGPVPATANASTPFATAAAAAGWHYLHARVLRGDGGGVPPAVTAPFPSHWTALFRTIGWVERDVDTDALRWPGDEA